MLRRLVPSEKYYAHDDWDRRTENICPEDMEFGNGHSHCMAMLLGPAGESIPVQDGELCLGHVAARPLHRARPLSRPPLARPGRRGVARTSLETENGAAADPVPLGGNLCPECPRRIGAPGDFLYAQEFRPSSGPGPPLRELTASPFRG